MASGYLLNPTQNPNALNMTESWYSLLERGIIEMFKYISDRYLDCHSSEIVFQWDRKKIDNAERMFYALESVKGK